MEQERIVYETLLGHRCTDVHWWRVKKTMKSCELPPTRQGFQLFISLRRISPKFYSQFHKVKKVLDQRMRAIGDGMTGAEVRRYLEAERISPSQSTLSRWFVKSGGYRAAAFYNKTVLTPVIAMALIYKHRNENQTPNTDDDNK